MNNSKRTSLEMLKKLGIFTGFCIFMITVLIVSIRMTSYTWQNKLRQNVYDILEENDPGVWHIGENVELNSSFSHNAICFKISDESEDNGNYAVMIKIQTICGPFPAVFIYSEKRGAEFIGFSNLHGRVSEMIKEHSSDSRILYWNKRIPAIMQKALGDTI